MSAAGDFVGLLFASRSLTHKAHLTTSVYARHIALGDFYDQIVGLADSFAETYAGKYGIIRDINVYCENDDREPADILREHLGWIENNRAQIAPGYSPIQNIIDEICAAYLQTLYKLENLM